MQHTTTTDATSLLLTLNVLSTIIDVPREVLCAVSGSKLDQRFGLNKDDHLKDDKGRPFVDVDPLLFAHVIDLLRQVLHQPGSSPTFTPESLQEAEQVFFLLKELALTTLVDKAVAWAPFRFDPHMKGPDMSVSSDGVLVRIEPGGAHQYAKADQGIAFGRYSWKVIVHKPCRRYWVGVSTLAGELVASGDTPRTWLLGGDPAGAPNMLTDGVRSTPAVNFVTKQGDVFDIQLDLTKPHSRTITFVVNGALTIPMSIADTSCRLYPTVSLAAGASALLRWDC